jgi:lysyl-tRNA synthetase class 1
MLEMLDNLHTEATGEEIQNAIYKIGRESGYENLRDFFRDLYKILLGQTDGPRLGSFIALFGINNTKDLILSKM